MQRGRNASVERSAVFGSIEIWSLAPSRPSAVAGGALAGLGASEMGAHSEQAALGYRARPGRGPAALAWMPHLGRCSCSRVRESDRGNYTEITRIDITDHSLMFGCLMTI
jgi:hypothetical protein